MYLSPKAVNIYKKKRRTLAKHSFWAKNETKLGLNTKQKCIKNGSAITVSITGKKLYQTFDV